MRRMWTLNLPTWNHVYWVTALVCALGAIASAQVTPTSNATFEERIAQLESANRALLRRVSELESHDRSKDNLDDLVGDIIDDLLEDRTASASGVVSRYSSVAITFQYYGSVGFQVGDPPPTNGGDSLFRFESIDLFVTAKLSPRLQILSETILEGDGNEVILDQERIFGVYQFAPEFYVKLGIEHSPISHWNRIYHHGTWLYVSVERPTIGSFEDGGGILPSHFAGLEIGGKFDLSVGEIRYTAIVSNGRGPVPTNRQVISDDNNAKALDLALEFAPSSAENLSIGAAFRYDLLPPDGSDPARTKSILEWIASGFVDWRPGDFQLIAEVVVVDHDDRLSGQQFRHISGYLQVAYSIGELTPYVRFDFKRMEQGDPYFLPQNSDLDRWEQIIGVRWDFEDNAALKFEIAFGDEELRHNSGRISTDGFVVFRFNFSWYF